MLHKDPLRTSFSGSGGRLHRTFPPSGRYGAGASRSRTEVVEREKQQVAESGESQEQQS